MNLADTLERLSELLPERVFSDGGDYRVRLWNSRERILMRDGVSSNYGLMVLEQALRLEIEERSWGWTVSKKPGEPSCWRALIRDDGSRQDFCAESTVWSPAHALALALIASLEAEVKT